MSTVPMFLMSFWLSLYSVSSGEGAAQQKTCADCGKGLVERTVWVPTWTTEKRVCTETCYRTEQRQRTCTTYKKVPVSAEGVIKTTVYVPKTVETPREIEVCTPVSKMVEQKYTIKVPVKERVTKTRMVTRCIPITETKTVCENGVERQVTVTCNKEVCVEEPYECEVDACAEVERTRQVRVWETKKEMKTVVDKCCTVVPEVREKKVPVTFCEEVPENHVETYCVCVPYEVQREIEVCVCKMVPRKMMIPACDCCD